MIMSDGDKRKNATQKLPPRDYGDNLPPPLAFPPNPGLFRATTPTNYLLKRAQCRFITPAAGTLPHCVRVRGEVGGG